LLKGTEISFFQPVLDNVYVFAPFEFEDLSGLKAKPMQERDINLVNKPTNGVRGISIRIGYEFPHALCESMTTE